MMFKLRDEVVHDDYWGHKIGDRLARTEETRGRGAPLCLTKVGIFRWRVLITSVTVNIFTML